LIYAPFGRDAQLLSGVLHEAGINGIPCSTMESMCAVLREGAGAILVGDEVLRSGGMRDLEAVIAEQPPWSDLPVFIMTSRGDGNEKRPSRLRLLESLGNVTLLERPLRAEMVVSSFRMALRARAHQYEIRDHLESERRSAEALREIFAEVQRAKSALEQSNEELRRANENLNQFAYSASHDLKEPLRMVAIYSQMLQRRYAPVLDEQATQYLSYAVQGAKRMNQLISDLLAYTQAVETGHEDVKPVMASEVFTRAMENLRSAIEVSHTSIESGPLPVLRVKETHLLQVFQNLLGNALKYRSETPPRIRVSAEQQDEMWKLSVRDNGIGIEPRYTQQVFGLFKRLHNGNSGYEGTGLGLAICQKIVERYGGRIWVESQGVGKGCIFFFTLPGQSDR
jgi:signal transduction histidine kinase